MGLVIPWSSTLALVDVYSIFFGFSLRVPGLMVIIVIGDMVCIYYLMVRPFHAKFLHPLISHHQPCQVLSLLSLAAACSSAGVINLLPHLGGAYCPPKFCGRYQLSTAMAFLSWFLSAASSLSNSWVVASW